MAIAPCDQKTSPMPTAMPTGPATPGSWVGWLTIEPPSWASPFEMSPKASPVWAMAKLTAAPGLRVNV